MIYGFLRLLAPPNIDDQIDSIGSDGFSFAVRSHSAPIGYLEDW